MLNSTGTASNEDVLVSRPFHCYVECSPAGEFLTRAVRSDSNGEARAPDASPLWQSRVSTADRARKATVVALKVGLVPRNQRPASPSGHPPDCERAPMWLQ